MTAVLGTLCTAKQYRPVQKRFKILSQNISHPLIKIVATFLSTAIPHMRNILCRRMSIFRNSIAHLISSVCPSQESVGKEMAS